MWLIAAHPADLQAHTGPDYALRATTVSYGDACEAARARAGAQTQQREVTSALVWCPQRHRHLWTVTPPATATAATLDDDDRDLDREDSDSDHKSITKYSEGGSCGFHAQTRGDIDPG